MSRRSHRAWIVPVSLVVALSLAVVGSRIHFAQGATLRDDLPTHEEELIARQGDGLETATFGSGCFWCSEAVFQEIEGVSAVVSGYSGGDAKRTSYREICLGNTGHAEVVQVSFDPMQVTFDELLAVFWKTHDPTTLNRQGADIGPQYRSVVFYHDENQKRIAEAYRIQLNELKTFKAPITTEITRFAQFFQAEIDHQNYFSRNSKKRYCEAVIAPKLAKFRKDFGDKLRKSTEDKENNPRSLKVLKTDEEWKKGLTEIQYRVTRKRGTERAFSGEYWDCTRDGIYHCVCCEASLFDSKAKFKSGTGWPSYFDRVDSSTVLTKVDQSLGMERTEVYCGDCDAHLGHVFADGPKPTGLRYCINSAALALKARGKKSPGEGNHPGNEDRGK